MTRCVRLADIVLVLSERCIGCRWVANVAGMPDNSLVMYALMRRSSSDPDVVEVVDLLLDDSDVFVCRIEGVPPRAAVHLDEGRDIRTVWPELVGLPWQVLGEQGNPVVDSDSVPPLPQ